MEQVDTPAGPAGRRGRWHETFSKFNITVKYIPGKDQTLPDAISRLAYPACDGFHDCSIHGSAEDAQAMKDMAAKEFAEESNEAIKVSQFLRVMDGNTPLGMERPHLDTIWQDAIYCVAHSGLSFAPLLSTSLCKASAQPTTTNPAEDETTLSPTNTPMQLASTHESHSFQVSPSSQIIPITGKHTHIYTVT